MNVDDNKPKLVVRCIADIGNYGYRYRKSAQPESPFVYVQQWYCQDTECAAREVEIKIKPLTTPGMKPPESAYCPLCGSTLKFHGYVNWDEVMPCE
jgi:hypothetical protein